MRPNPIGKGLPAGHTAIPTNSEPSGKDLPANTSTLGRVKPVSTRAHGKIGNNGDQDYFKIDMYAGYSYRIDVKESETSALGGTLGDPRVELRDSGGNALSNGSLNLKVTGSDSTNSSRIADDDSGEGNNARLEINVLENKRYYVSVSEDGNNATGTYTAQVTITGNHGLLFPMEGSQGSVSEQAGQDLPDNRGATTGRVQVNGDPATGNISTNGDTDGFIVSLTGGRTYRIEVKGNESSDQGGTLGDPYVLFKGPRQLRPDLNQQHHRPPGGGATGTGPPGRHAGP